MEKTEPNICIILLMKETLIVLTILSKSINSNTEL